MLCQRVEGGSGVSTGGATLGGESGGTLGSRSGDGLEVGNIFKSFLRASLVGLPLEREGVAGVGLASLWWRSSKAAAILSWDDVWGSGNFWGRKTTVGQCLVLLVEGM